MITKFNLNKAQKEKFEQWKKTQLNKNNKHISVVGGRWSFKFTQTGIGICVVAIDELLNEENDLTDYSEFD